MLKTVCNLIFRLYAYSDATKIIHYSTNSNHTHQLCDEIRDTILDFVDDLAEQSFGIIGKPSFNDMELTSDITVSDNLDGICTDAMASVEDYYSKCTKDPKMTPIVSLIDDFNGKMSQKKFLATFDKHSNYKNK